ncbi:flagellar assembly protein FliH [Halobacillus shinanisalinarum]|uniref:Flagellar assembly protein FliH n=1 Tax=Halobacillus shinanisalinarum TaxID=2932258 RepID=A0ABY4GYS9_9BACI|nr:flagellar assembly protein FliH [Halobacillus shinanisalinarum]UOQ93219.1 flagellar assembly protein FliH [Halobacillus shinanisalinarum]
MSKNSTDKRVIGLKPVHMRKPETENQILEEQHEEKAQELFEAAKQERQQANEEAARKLEEAEQGVAHMRKSWEEERESLIAQAYNEGFASGVQEGKEKGYQEFSEQLQHINHILSLANKDYIHTVSASEEMILELAISSAEKIINQQLAFQPETFLPVVKKAIEEVQDHPEITVYVHPYDYELIHTQKSELTSITGVKATLTIYINDSLARYGCVIESPFGRVEAGVDHQLTQLREKLYQLVQEEKSDE